jgi:hypothetical protein
MCRGPGREIMYLLNKATPVKWLPFSSWWAPGHTHTCMHTHACFVGGLFSLHLMDKHDGGVKWKCWHQAGIWVLALILCSCVTLAIWLNFSVLQFPHPFFKCLTIGTMEIYMGLWIWLPTTESDLRFKNSLPSLRAHGIPSRTTMHFLNQVI